MEDLRGGAADPAEALGLAVAEDRAEVSRRALVHGEGLGEEDRALGVVAVGVVDQLDRDELGVVVAAGLELGDELGPGGADQQRLEAGVAGGVLLVHREDDQVLDPVLAVLLGMEGVGRGVEVGLAEVRRLPGGEVRGERREVGGLVGEARRQSASTSAAIAAVSSAVRARSCLERSTEPSGSWVSRSSATAVLQRQPVRVGGGLGGAGSARRRGEGRAGGPVDEVEPEGCVVEVADAVVAEEVGVGEHRDPAGAVLGDRRQRGARGVGGVVGAGDRPRRRCRGRPCRRGRSRPRGRGRGGRGRRRWRGRGRPAPRPVPRGGARSPARSRSRPRGRSGRAAR